MKKDQSDKPSKPKSYRVVLKSGKHAVFTNDNNFDNYEARLLSGMYGIATGRTNEQITPETVLKIEEVVEDEEADIDNQP